MANIHSLLKLWNIISHDSLNARLFDQSSSNVKETLSFAEGKNTTMTTIRPILYYDSFFYSEYHMPIELVDGKVPTPIVYAYQYNPHNHEANSECLCLQFPDQERCT